MHSLIHCIYASTAAEQFSDATLRELLAQARETNAGLNVTGLLLHTDGSFFQALEGEAMAVDALYANIALDKRHKNVTQIIREPIAKRSFGEWSMGFTAISAAEFTNLSGFNDFFNNAENFERLDAGRVKKILRAFAQGRWRQRVNPAEGQMAAHAN